MIYAVLTADIVNSTSLDKADRELLLNTLKGLSSQIDGIEFHIFRGDAFQGLSEKPWLALEQCIKTRAYLLKTNTSSRSVCFDARMAIGLGGVSLKAETIEESDGEAFRNSGQLLDEKSSKRLLFKSPWEEINAEMQVLCILLDVIINKWTLAQAEVIWERLNGFNQMAIAQKLGISQASVNNRLKLAEFDALQTVLNRYQTIIQAKTKSNA
ncbi:SatD family protein [Solitalea lacus]|uniref:SatD family protein n=1 Tax=Solitalea lacus TaxID=2911172 RepID=UPI001EDC2C18|nr:SatD family protein [Solitalea lacus]UKJ06013.1 SatD family protein [Solitalea lacus]